MCTFIPAGFVCGGICDALCLLVLVGGGGGGGISALTLTYLCGSKPMVEYCYNMYINVSGA